MNFHKGLLPLSVKKIGKHEPMNFYDLCRIVGIVIAWYN